VEEDEEEIVLLIDDDLLLLVLLVLLLLLSFGLERFWIWFWLFASEPLAVRAPGPL